ncbi:MAG: cytochrome c peroxidase [Gammaproteobacteria bacterium]
MSTRKLCSWHSRVWVVMALCAGHVSATAQGRSDYFNVESPQVHALEVVRLGGHDYLAALNTRNGTLEIYDTNESADDRRLARVRVGLEPVSVRYNARLSRLYVANFLGDSLSVIGLSAPKGPASLRVGLIETTPVGDEPLDIAFHTQMVNGEVRERLFVTHMALDGVGWRDALTLAPVQADTALRAAIVNAPIDDDLDGNVDETIARALKEPRTVLVRDDKLLVLAAKGGSDEHDAFGFDLDLYCADAATPFDMAVGRGGIGTTGFNMAFAPDGSLFVASGTALNRQLTDEHAVRDAPTGFVRSQIHRVAAPCATDSIVQTRDVNLWQPSGPLPSPVPRSRALSTLTSLAVYADESATKVFFTAFSNDRVGVLQPAATLLDAGAWPLNVVDIPTFNANPMAGPNALAIKYGNPQQLNDPGPRVYVLNHLDNSIVVLDPISELLVDNASLSLSHDPRPDYIRLGQPFLYDARLSANGFVSCASCHMWGRTDGLAWDLGTPEAQNEEVPPALVDALPPMKLPADKDLMVTQSLQGLLNFEVEPADAGWVTNAPYHWRADREDFKAFNGSFRSLLGGAMLDEVEMARFEAFINSISYPPNPKQLRARQPSGFFDPTTDVNMDTSTLGQRGLKVYHVFPTTASARSCAMCHSLPEGSNNLITDLTNQPTETAAIRGLFQKEARRSIDGLEHPDQAPYTGFEGLFHLGTRATGAPLLVNTVASINEFNRTFFSSSLCPTGDDHCVNLQALNQFVHEVDWGAAPMIGCAVTVTMSQVDAIEPLPVGTTACAAACADNVGATLMCMEQQAGSANAGVAVQASLAGSARGFWFDPVTQRYQPLNAAASSLKRTELLDALQVGDRLVFQSVPLGSERRVAAPDGVAPAAVDGPAPDNIALLPMVANSFYENVTNIEGVWRVRDNEDLESVFLHQVRLLQWGLIKDGADANGFGLGADIRDDAPRRFQVAGNHIRHGARLHLHYHNDDAAAAPDPGGPLDQLKTGVLSLPLYPTDASDPVTGAPIWQTAVELEPHAYYQLMLGGPRAPGVAAALADNVPFTFPMVNASLDEPPHGLFSPLRWNFLFVQIENADGSTGEGGWQRLTLGQ